MIRHFSVPEFIVFMSLIVRLIHWLMDSFTENLFNKQQRILSAGCIRRWGENLFERERCELILRRQKKFSKRNKKCTLSVW
jgi:hypothetical protein